MAAECRLEILSSAGPIRLHQGPVFCKATQSRVL
uniref:Uncharacterized protein n=1 Tax=Anguilla anguilla TaxID=7936 RepID=A0A0E9RV93_ANGAN